MRPALARVVASAALLASSAAHLWHTNVLLTSLGPSATAMLSLDLLLLHLLFSCLPSLVRAPSPPPSSALFAPALLHLLSLFLVFLSLPTLGLIQTAVLHALPHPLLTLLLIPAFFPSSRVPRFALLTTLLLLPAALFFVPPPTSPTVLLIAPVLAALLAALSFLLSKLQAPSQNLHPSLSVLLSPFIPPLLLLRLVLPPFPVPPSGVLLINAFLSVLPIYLSHGLLARLHPLPHAVLHSLPRLLLAFSSFTPAPRPSLLALSTLPLLLLLSVPAACAATPTKSPRRPPRSPRKKPRINAVFVLSFVLLVPSPIVLLLLRIRAVPPSLLPTRLQTPSQTLIAPAPPTPVAGNLSDATAVFDVRLAHAAPSIAEAIANRSFIHVLLQPYYPIDLRNVTSYTARPALVANLFDQFWKHAAASIPHFPTNPPVHKCNLLQPVRDCINSLPHPPDRPLVLHAPLGPALDPRFVDYLRQLVRYASHPTVHRVIVNGAALLTRYPDLDDLQPVLHELAASRVIFLAWGDISAAFLRHHAMLGDRVMVTGCGSLFLSTDERLSHTLSEKYDALTRRQGDRSLRVAVSIKAFPRYYWFITTLLEQYPNAVFIAQSEFDLKGLEQFGVPFSKVRLYGDAPFAISDMQHSIDVAVGPRVHHVIAALAAGVPAFLVDADVTTHEMAASMSLPAISAIYHPIFRDRQQLDMSVLARVAPFNASAFDIARCRAAVAYKGVYGDVGLVISPHIRKLSAMCG